MLTGPVLQFRNPARRKKGCPNEFFNTLSKGGVRRFVEWMLRQRTRGFARRELCCNHVLVDVSLNE